jgi:glycerol-3-phosphate dehydrogenase
VKRDLTRLASAEFDLLVVGGGIYGLAVAYDAAQRGLSVALVERKDFGSATSFNHLKTIHGGLRYLQTADLRRMRESIRERRAFARIAPRLVAPLPFVMATSDSLTRAPWAMQAAFALDALIGSDRNDGLDASHRLPPGGVISSDECRALVGPEWPSGRRGAVWYDYETIHGDRLTLAFALAAAAHGATLANYVEAVGPLKTMKTLKAGGGVLAGVRARDLLVGDATFDIRARVVVNAAGPWTSAVLAQVGVNRTWPLLKAMNLVTSRPAQRAALVAPTASGRALVLLPWQGRTLVGTSESAEEHQADDQLARRTELSGFLAEVNDTFRDLSLNSGDVTLVHRGIVPAASRHGRLTLLGHSIVIDHAADGVRDLVSLVGVKYTTARVVAERAVDLVLRKLAKRAVSCRTAETMLPTAGPDDRQPDDPIRHAVDAEMAQTLTDVVVRRTGLGAAGYPGDGVVNECAGMMQQICRWSTERAASEIAALKRFYDIE